MISFSLATSSISTLRRWLNRCSGAHTSTRSSVWKGRSSRSGCRIARPSPICTSSRSTRSTTSSEWPVRTGHSEDVVDLVLRDEVQIGLGRAIRHPDLELRPFHTEDLVLVCAPEHRFSQRRSVLMEEVASEKLIMFDLTSSYYEITQAAFLSA